MRGRRRNGKRSARPPKGFPGPVGSFREFAPWALLPAAAFFLLASGSCGRSDPLARALRERQGLAAELLSWAPRGGRIHLELRVLGNPRSLSHLTVLVTQYDPEEEPIRRDRVPIDLKGIRSTGSKQMFVSVPAAGTSVESLSVEVEVRPPEGSLREFPELEPYL